MVANVSKEFFWVSFSQKLCHIPKHVVYVIRPFCRVSGEKSPKARLEPISKVEIRRRTGRTSTTIEKMETRHIMWYGYMV